MATPKRALCALAAVVTMVAGFPAVAQATSADPEVQIVQLRHGVSLAEGAAMVRSVDGRVLDQLPIIRGLAVWMTRRQQLALARDPRIEAVTVNETVGSDEPPANETPAPPDEPVPAATPVASDAGAVPTPEGATPSTGDPVDPALTPEPDPSPVPAETPEPDPSPVPAGTPWDFSSRLATAYPFSVLAPQVWPRATGKGIGVAVIDTGIDGALPDFQASDGSSRVIASVVTNPDATNSEDGYGHGTHVAGIIAGDGTRRPADDPAAGKYVGIAPDANLIAIKASDDQGRGTILDAIYGLQFAVDHQAEYNIRVVNLSLSSTTPQSYLTDPLDAAVEAAYFHGILVVAAVGNRGSAADATAYAPGNDPFALSVGGADDQGTAGRDDDAFADWSSVGTTQDGFAKPDIAAPGAHIVSTLARGSAFTDLCPACVVDDEYFRVGGSSMAAPVVAGVAALVFEAHPDWTPDDVKSTLVETARNVEGGVDEVNASAALAQEWPFRGANADIAPNQLIDSSDGGIDYARSSWGRSSWGAAPETLGADWARSSWGCTCTSSQPTDQIEQTRSSWGSATWLSNFSR